MVIDTSAIVAMLLCEPDIEALELAIAADMIRLVPATCVLEVRTVLTSRRGKRAIAEVDQWLDKIEAGIIPIDGDSVDLATQAWLADGKGRRPAALNFADCFSSAPAKRTEEPLLFIGQDFSRTDIRAVVQ